MSRTVFAMDPGSTVSTAVITQGMRIVTRYRDVDNEAWLDLIPAVISYLRANPPHSPIVIEDIEMMGMSVGMSVFHTVRWTGRFQQVALDCDAEVQFLKRTEVKLNLCHSRRANGKNVEQAIVDRYGDSRKAVKGTKAAPGPLYGFADHLWSALAVALTWLDQNPDQEVSA